MPSSSQRVADLSGRPLGARALQTRRRMLDATRGLLSERGLRELRVADIARAVGTSPATFYQYFADVESVVLQLARDANEELPDLLSLFEGTWRGDQGRRRARDVVEFFMDYWDRHGPVLRVRNLAADEGDGRFMELRGAAMLPILAAMEALMVRSGGATRRPEQSHAAVALAMSAVLDRLAAYHRVMELGALTHEELVATTADLLRRSLTGR